MKELSKKEKVFCENYLKTLNGNDSARKAGYSDRYSRTSTILLRRSHIRDYIQKKLKERFQNLEIEGKDVLRELMMIAFANIGDFLEMSRKKLKITDINKIDKDKMKAIESIETKGQGYRIKLFPKTRALERLLQYFGVMNDSTHNQNEPVNNIKLEIIRTEHRVKVEGTPNPDPLSGKEDNPADNETDNPVNSEITSEITANNGTDLQDDRSL